MKDSFAEQVYHSLSGLLVAEARAAQVENAFSPGSRCERLYFDMLDAYDRLRSRLGVEDEDSDVEVIIRSLLQIQDELCIKMFHYGQTLSDPGNTP